MIQVTKAEGNAKRILLLVGIISNIRPYCKMNTFSFGIMISNACYSILVVAKQA